ncbi:MAG: GH92 family glycosyl hydrolase, partial [Cyclobacteriaceae bacterium]|nr:GH92 family glycosyl hydrolase [Cyclobacteriaceae bacterium]
MMNNRYKNSITLLLVVFFAFSCQQEQSSTNTDYIDMDIGGVGHLLKPTRPTVQLPNQMVRMYPRRLDYIDDQISWFPMSIIGHRRGELFGFKAVNGKNGNENPEYMLTYDHDLEIKKPWYYSAWLVDDDIQVEYAPGAKSGIFRLQLLDDEFTLLFSTLQKGSFTIQNNILEGVEEFEGMKAFVYGVFSQTGESGTGEGFGLTLKGEKRKANYAWLSSTSLENGSVSFKYGFSFISIEKAKENLEREIPEWDFDAVKAKGKQVWESKINQINVKGGTEAQRRTFYTSLYRTYERMVDINEGGQYFSGYDRQVHDSEKSFYVDDWVWDTYLAHHPLRMILDPDQEADMLKSYVSMYRQSGWMPQFPEVYGDNPAMNSFHSTVVFLDAWRKGIRDFDQEAAYEGMRKNATSATMLPWRNGPNCSLDSFYYEHGYYPALHPGEEETEGLVHSFERRQAVAVTLGHSYDDWALAQMAKELGKENDYELFLPKSKNYRNLYNAKEKLMWPKDANGDWIDIDPKFDGGPGGRDYYDENNGYTFAWQVQQDIPDLIALMGGR